MQRRGKLDNLFFVKNIKKVIFLGLFLSSLFLFQPIRAATITWVGGSSTWETGSNWSGGVVPTSTDDVIVSSSTAFTITLSSGQLASFNTLTLGGGSATSTLILVGTIGTGGSVTVDNNGKFEQKSTSTLTFTGAFTVKSGGYVTHTVNTTQQLYVVDISAREIDIQAGGQINVLGKGYSGGAAGGGTGQGPGGGAGTNVAASAQGGSHGGIGGNFGPAAYCNISNVNTIGSGGGSGNNSNEVNAKGGGLVRLNSTGTTTINGLITAKGAGAQGNAFSGAGAGGGIKIVAQRITGTPVEINASGGNAIPSFSFDGGSGGGGCVQILYTISNSISSVNVDGGTEVFAGAVGLSSISQNNTAPTTTSFTPTQLSSTTVQFSTTISDSDSQATSLAVEYSTNNGTTWASSTLGTVTASSGTVTTSTGQISSIDTDTGSITLTIPWMVATDIPNMDTSTVKIRITPNDGVTNGAINTSSAFSVDTKKPTQPTNLTMGIPTTSTVPLGLPTTTSTDTNFLDYKIYYNTTSPVTITGSAFTSSSDSNLANPNFNGATTSTVTGLTPNTTYYFNLFAFDTWGHSTSSVSEVSTTTDASVPSSLTASADSGTQITLSWSGDATQYYAENTTLSTNSGWQSATTYAFSGLTCNTSYTFKVKGRNSVSRETSFTSTVSATTSACTNNSGGGGGGGGGIDTSGSLPGSFPDFALGNLSVTTPSMIITTTSMVLNFYITHASEMMISENPFFAGAEWQPYASSVNFQLTTGEGDKYVYVKFRSKYGKESYVATVHVIVVANTSTPPQLITDDGFINNEPSNSTSLITFTNLPQSPLTPGDLLTFKYSYQNIFPTKQTIKIVRQVIQESTGNSMLTASAVPTLKPGQSFSFTPKDILTSKYSPDFYTVKISIYDSTGTILHDSNWFTIEVLPVPPPPPLQIKFARVPTQSLKLKQYLTFSYGMKNTTGQKQTFRILREVISHESTEVLISSKGYRQLKPNQSFSYSPKDRITKKFTPGFYTIRVSVYDERWKEVLVVEERVVEVR